MSQLSQYNLHLASTFLLSLASTAVPLHQALPNLLHQVPNLLPKS